MRPTLRLLAAGTVLTGVADRGEAAERHPCRSTIRRQNPTKTRVFRVERHRVETCRAARAQARERCRPEYGGRLFFTDNGLNYVCSASTINNNYKNLIITAGHCVHSSAGGN